MKNIELKGAGNTRDFGGIKNKEGKEIKPHQFLRSAALDHVNKKDIEMLKNEYGLKTVIDLRTNTEKDESPDKVISGVKYYHIPVFSEETAGITHEKSADKREILNNLPDMCELYKNIVSREDCLENLRKVFEVIVNEDNNTVLWHCTEGKDRCGIVSALFLMILDVPLNVVYEDYLFTNTAKSKNRDKYYFLIRYLMRNRELAEKVKRLFSAEKEYLDTAIDEINRLWGGSDKFLREKIGITDEIKQQMKEKYLT